MQGASLVNWLQSGKGYGASISKIASPLVMSINADSNCGKSSTINFNFMKNIRHSNFIYLILAISFLNNGMSENLKSEEISGNVTAKLKAWSKELNDDDLAVRSKALEKLEELVNSQKLSDKEVKKILEALSLEVKKAFKESPDGSEHATVHQSYLVRLLKLISYISRQKIPFESNSFNEDQLFKYIDTLKIKYNE